ncbi:3-dehydroquinate synthase [Streptomyces sp. G44]|uniref:3-dehydroquinate synthase n=1 Tax=Streptomyces sp. G44 TaxID=2807632 RepID=UPI00195F4FDC|nr:3-dehydroquinate synthase [Streptomyces sp. G44]MBM7167625.1 3-dehydroquinate synthase [Streptomyces sp. G44]
MAEEPVRPVPRTVVVRAGSITYPFAFDSGQLNRTGTWREAVDGARTVAVITSRPVAALFPEALRAIAEAGARHVVIEVPDGEDAKTLDIVNHCYQALAQAQFTRNDLVIALGGGTVTDLAGFVAGTRKRGTRLVHAPTTLLALVDAAIGGKTGINLPSGKNLVGTFHQPERVVADDTVLSSLPARELRSGLAEVIKCGFIAEPAILDDLPDPARAASQQSERYLRLIEMSVRVKARLLADDVADRGPRRHLNYGHTAGQAIEMASGFTLRHGEAVALGMVYAARVCELLTGTDGIVSDTRDALTRVGLPTRLDATVSFEQMWELMRQDKKVTPGRPSFVVSPRPGTATLTPMPEHTTARAAFDDVLRPG